MSETSWFNREADSRPSPAPEPQCKCAMVPAMDGPGMMPWSTKGCPIHDNAEQPKPSPVSPPYTPQELRREADDLAGRHEDYRLAGMFRKLATWMEGKDGH